MAIVLGKGHGDAHPCIPQVCTEAPPSSGSRGVCSSISRQHEVFNTKGHKQRATLEVKTCVCCCCCVALCCCLLLLLLLLGVACCRGVTMCMSTRCYGPVGKREHSTTNNCWPSRAQKLPESGHSTSNRTGCEKRP